MKKSGALILLISMLTACSTTPVEESFSPARQTNKAVAQYLPCPAIENIMGTQTTQYITRACISALQEGSHYHRLRILALSATAYADNDDQTYAKQIIDYLVPQIEKRLAHGQKQHLLSLTAVAMASLGDSRQAMNMAARIKGQRQQEWRSDVYSAIALYYWQQGDVTRFRTHLRKVRHPYSYSSTVARLVLHHYNIKYDRKFYLQLIHSADKRNHKIDLVQQRIKLNLAMALACYKLQSHRCSADYLQKAEQQVRGIKAKDYSFVKRKAHAQLFISRSYAYMYRFDKANELAGQIKHREWRAFTLPPLAYSHYQYNHQDKTFELLEQSWALTEDLKSNLYRSKEGIQTNLLSDIAVTFTRLGLHHKTEELAEMLNEPYRRAEVYLDSAQTTQERWLPFSLDNQDYL